MEVSAEPSDYPVAETPSASETPADTLPEFELTRHALSRPAAFAQLFQVWRHSFDPSTGELACDRAVDVGLSCLEQRGSLRSLVFLDRPVMLTLEAPGVEPRYAVLRSLHGRRATLLTESGLLTVSLAELEQYWFGKFLLLWQLPDYADSGNLYTESAERELWLGARMMQLAEKLGGSEQEIARVKALPLTQQIEWYQQHGGLTVDGIAGARTLIRINNDLGAEVPTLQGEK